MDTKVNTLVHETQLFGPIDYFALYNGFIQLKIEKYDHYQKRSWRNRFQILTANGLLMLSIPLTKGKNNHQIITDVTISYDENWPSSHLHTIRSAYSNSPYFEHYYPEIETLFYKKYKFLIDLNENAMQWLKLKIGLPSLISYTVEYQKKYNDYFDFRDKYIIPSAPIIKYPQVWQDKFEFVPNLSILDLLFCTGPEAPGILKKINTASIL